MNSKGETQPKSKESDSEISSKVAGSSGNSRISHASMKALPSSTCSEKMVTRFAPSPTGFLHIGGARTALFNWLLARHYGGKFLLRIEDTDRERSTQAAVEAIINGLKWLGIKWDGEPVFQFARASHHVELAKKLVEEGKAYYCYCTPKELEEMRESAKARGESPRYNGMWRDRDPKTAPEGVDPVIRLKAPLDGETTLHDIVQGDVTVRNDQMDDMVLVRSDGTPTFMLSVVVDDHDMGVTHVIRGDDHLTNTFRQIQLHNALGWDIPVYGHIPLIHGPDGAKLSKRHGALAVEAYRDMGFLPEAVCNCLLRLGWSHGNDEIIPTEQAIEWFTPDNLGKSASRLDFQKMARLNAHYMKEADNERLLGVIEQLGMEGLEDPVKRRRVFLGMNGLKERAKTTVELKDLASIYTEDFVPSADSFPVESKEILRKVLEALSEMTAADSDNSSASSDKESDKWTEENIDVCLHKLAEKMEISFGKVAQTLRSVLSSRKVTPGIFEMLYAFGRDESLKRIVEAIGER